MCRTAKELLLNRSWSTAYWWTLYLAPRNLFHCWLVLTELLDTTEPWGNKVPSKRTARLISHQQTILGFVDLLRSITPEDISGRTTFALGQHAHRHSLWLRAALHFISRGVTSCECPFRLPNPINKSRFKIQLSTEPLFKSWPIRLQWGWVFFRDSKAR